MVQSDHLHTGQKKAREMWFLARMYNAQQALDMGLVNTVVPLDKLEEETLVWSVFPCASPSRREGLYCTEVCCVSYIELSLQPFGSVSPSCMLPQV